MAEKPEKRLSALSQSLAAMTVSAQDQRRTALKGKRIVIVGAGYIGKKVIFDRAVELGIKIVLVDLPGTWAAPIVEHFCPVDTLDHEHAAEEAVKAVKALNIPVDGVCTFWENDVPLCAQVAAGLGKIGNSYESCMTARSKYNTRAAMRKAGLPTPAFHMIRSPADMEDAIAKVPFPCVLKPIFGAEAQGASKVMNGDEARAAFNHIRSKLSVEYDTIYSWGCEFILEQYLDGDEVDVDLLLWDGHVVFHSITDNLETNEPDFLNTASLLPTVLPVKKQVQLVELASRTCTNAVGLRYGAAHVEMKYTSNGPHIVEVNARVAGNPYFEWIRTVWGVDFIEEVFMCCCGIPICPFKPEMPLTCLAGSFLLSNSCALFTQADYDKLMSLTSDARVYEVKIEVEPPYTVTGAPKGREELGWITCNGTTIQSAVRHLYQVTGPDSGNIPPYLSCKQATLPAHLREPEDGPVQPTAPPKKQDSTFAYVKEKLGGVPEEALLNTAPGKAGSIGSYTRVGSCGRAGSLGKVLSPNVHGHAFGSPNLREPPRVIEYSTYKPQQPKQS
mmetsp:Transcript_21632/g.37142  ORF Transcript_21632/g.37142 Transcript_21632/m.37142 type:complete len:559 (-) Transcript_21632:62-1738(-)|eukprot:CAMPEP_0196666826 /NCGR_PEP_ID=MMETSP1086-20130531/64734_1 /TAXON_ID=77921 /ORGANISM="Cyanoptyche  gloeocystis , Strain SAG4.97" /LENGTH=558 /DNA_ID=CAMNT_0042004071 /DNA_START=101 /DNA_END=1777 /DNA_ORIENTATION=-